MRSVQLDPIESETLGVARATRIGGNHVRDLRLAHRLADLAPSRLGHAGGCHRPLLRIRVLPQAPHRADVPELRNDLGSSRMHFIHHLAPCREGLFAIEGRDIRKDRGGRMVDHRRFRHDQPDVVFGAAPVIHSHIIPRDAARREVACHGRHDYAIGQFEIARSERTEQWVCRLRHGVSALRK